jgi:hypothetical protein
VVDRIVMYARAGGSVLLGIDRQMNSKKLHIKNDCVPTELFKISLPSHVLLSTRYDQK